MKTANIKRNYGRNGIEIRFNEATNYLVNIELKRLGFKYSNRQGIFYAIYSAELERQLKEKLNELGISIEGEEELSEEQKEAIKQQAEQRKEQELKQKANAYSDTENAKLAVMSVNEFMKFVRNAGSRSYTVYGTRWDFMPKEIEFHNLPKGRKRPDKKSVFWVHGSIQNEALRNGLVVPLGNYFNNPNHKNSTSERTVDNIKRMVREHKQQLNAPDYESFLEFHENKAAEEKRVAEQWEAYRQKYVYPLKTGWKIDSNKKTIEVNIKKGTGFTDRNDTVSIEFGSGWITYNEPILLRSLYIENPIENPGAKTVLETYPFEEFINGNSTNENPKIALLKLKLKLQTQTLELLLKL